MTKTDFINYVMTRLGLAKYNLDPRYYYMVRTLDIASEKAGMFQRYNFSRNVLSIVAEEFGITTGHLYDRIGDLIKISRTKGSIKFFYEFLCLSKDERIPKITCYEFIYMLAIYIAKHMGTLASSSGLSHPSVKKEYIFSYLDVDLSSKSYVYLNEILDLIPKEEFLGKRGSLRRLYVKIAQKYNTTPTAVSHVIEHFSLQGLFLN